MAHCGHALIGDPVYGGRRKLSPKSIGQGGVAAVSGFSRQALHAASLGFVHPGATYCALCAIRADTIYPMCVSAGNRIF